MNTPLGVTSAGTDLPVKAGAVLASSLDLPTTMGQVARLTVPQMADLCVIGLQAEDGSIREVAVAAGDEALARDLEVCANASPSIPAASTRSRG